MAAMAAQEQRLRRCTLDQPGPIPDMKSHAFSRAAPCRLAKGFRLGAGQPTGAKSKNKVVHPLSIRPLSLTTLASSGPVTLRHPK